MDVFTKESTFWYYSSQQSRASIYFYWLAIKHTQWYIYYYYIKSRTYFALVVVIVKLCRVRKFVYIQYEKRNKTIRVWNDRVIITWWHLFQRSKKYYEYTDKIVFCIHIYYTKGRTRFGHVNSYTSNISNILLISNYYFHMDNVRFWNTLYNKVKSSLVDLAAPT